MHNIPNMELDLFQKIVCLFMLGDGMIPQLQEWELCRLLPVNLWTREVGNQWINIIKRESLINGTNTSKLKKVGKNIKIKKVLMTEFKIKGLKKHCMP